MAERALSDSLLDSSFSRHKPLIVSKKCRFPFTLPTLFVSAAMVMFLEILLATNTETCEFPIREWLHGYSVFSGATFLLALSIELIACSSLLESECLQKGIQCSIIMVALVALAGTVLGSIWLFSSETCEEDFSLAYTAMFCILLVYYVLFSISCCVLSLLFLLGWIFSGFLLPTES